MEKQTNTCKVCHKEKNVNELYLTDFQLYFCQTPPHLLKKVICKECYSAKKRVKNKDYFEKKKAMWKLYQKEYHERRREKPSEILFDRLQYYINQNRELLKLPDLVWCDISQEMQKGIVKINKNNIIEFCEKNNISLNFKEFKKYFDDDFIKIYKTFKNDIKIVSRLQMLTQRKKHDNQFIANVEIEKLDEKIDKKDIDLMRVICSYLYFITNHQIYNKKVQKCLLDTSYINESKMFLVQKVNSESRKDYYYVRTSKFAKKYILKHFGINSKNILDKEKEIFNLIQKYLNEVLKNEKDAKAYYPLFTSGFKNLCLEFYINNFEIL